MLADGPVPREPVSASRFRLRLLKAVIDRIDRALRLFDCVLLGLLRLCIRRSKAKPVHLRHGMIADQQGYKQKNNEHQPGAFLFVIHARSRLISTPFLHIHFRFCFCSFYSAHCTSNHAGSISSKRFAYWIY